MKYDSHRIWVEAIAGESPHPWHAYSLVPTLAYDAQPITTSDEKDERRIYLPTWLGPGLVVAIIREIVWLAPLLSEDDFSDSSTSDAIFTATEEGKVSAWVYLPPLPASKSRGFVVPMYSLTVLPVPFVRTLLTTGPQEPLGALSNEGREVARGVVTALLAVSL